MKKTLIALSTAAAIVIALPLMAAPAAKPAAKPASKPEAAKTDTAAPAADAGVKRDIPPDLAKQAKITLDAARTTALAKVPGGKVVSEELEKENGKLVYSFDIKVGDKPGVEEVVVSAITGKVLAKHHESEKAEKAEAQKDKKPATPPPAKGSGG